MIIYDLICECGFQVEGWFTSFEDYQAQLQKKLITCPLCSSHKVHKKPSAPYVITKGHKESSANNEPEKASVQIAPESIDSVATRPRSRPRSRHRHAQDIRRLRQSSGSKNSDKGELSEFAQTIGRIIEMIIKNTEDVGKKFVVEARKIHNNEAPVRAIRGEATLAEFIELEEEGIECIPLPLPSKKDMN